MLADELKNSLSTPRELMCGENSFKLKMNPWQHPIFDENIHHLLTLVFSLCRGCGGVVFLVVDDIENVTRDIFQVYKERLHELINRNLRPLSFSTNMVQICSLLGTQRAWAALLLKKSYDTMKYPPVQTTGTWEPTSFGMDIFGQMLMTPVSASQRTERFLSSPTCRETNIPHQAEPETAAVCATASKTVTEHKDYISKVNLSRFTRLDWTENTNDWQKYVKIKSLNTDDIAASCPMWKPTQPMKITPDRDSLRYLFKSERDMEETLSKVTTMDPGCAVVCRTWRFHILDGKLTEELPSGHVCDILTVTDTGRLSFWMIIESFDDETIHNQMEYLMTTGRMLKYQIVQKGEGGDLSNLLIDCRLLPVSMLQSTKKAVELILSESREIQAHLCEMYRVGVDFGILQRALTKLILVKESQLKRCIVEHTNITLSVQQAEVLMHKAKVNYITGPAGSGKSYTAASLYEMYGKERSVYICTTKAFLEYLTFNGYTGTLVLGDQDLLRAIKSGTFENKICIVIDDCHTFRCTRASMKKLFNVLKRNRDIC